MKPRDVFGLILRAAGVYLLVQGIATFVGFLYTFGELSRQLPDDHFKTKIYFFGAIIYVIIGIYFLRGAPHLLALAYPEPKTPTTDTKSDDTNAA